MSCVGCTEELGHLETAPLVIGEPNGAPAARYRVDAPILGRARGTLVWLTGAGVAPFIDGLWLVPDGV